MELVANAFSQSIQRAIEEDGILSSQHGADKLRSVYNMDQTAFFIDMGGKTTIDFSGSVTVDVHQGSETNGFRASVFLAASATGEKLRQKLVFAAVPGRPVSREVWDPAFGDGRVVHTVQKKAFCNEAFMQEWIELGSRRLTDADSLF
ncbi:hypothetical protein PR001_g2230 [Phytophthora rubi]|uniref:DDE-1 domain-containing protein n=1 Tax=Phytophthora rubi TaxID=129364 RepID=A0A6A3P9G3_9STRA|nr:hypothetical protein PR001_g2230 [Phytophthora rubi]